MRTRGTRHRHSFSGHRGLSRLFGERRVCPEHERISKSFPGGKSSVSKGVGEEKTRCAGHEIRGGGGGETWHSLPRTSALRALVCVNYPELPELLEGRG